MSLRVRRICAKQTENVRKHGISPVISINHFSSDFQSETDAIIQVCKEMDVRVAVANHWAEGGGGATDLAKAVIDACNEPNHFKYLYDLDRPIKEKIETIAKEIYGAGEVTYEADAEGRSKITRRMALVACRSAWQRPTSASLPTRH